MPEKNLEKNRKFLEENRSELLSTYRNKFILIFEEKVVGSFDTYENAAREAIRVYGPEANFLIHQMTDSEPLNFVLNAKF